MKVETVAKVYSILEAIADFKVECEEKVEALEIAVSHLTVPQSDAEVLEALRVFEGEVDLIVAESDKMSKLAWDMRVKTSNASCSAIMDSLNHLNRAHE